MEMSSKMLKPITEVKYLNAENVERYRAIIRFFYNEYQHIKYQLQKEEIFEALKSNHLFSDYTMEKCQSDLDALCEWKNLIAFQDTTKVTSIAQYRSKRFRYQLSEYTVEIERMVLKLENLGVDGASLEPSLLERIQEQISIFDKVSQFSDEKTYNWWRSLNEDFIRLNQNYQDYIRTLNNHRAEEMMKSQSFLVFKDNLIVYLSNFVKSLQEYGSTITLYLKEIDSSQFKQILKKVIKYEQSIPRIEQNVDFEELARIYMKRWENLNNWFIGSGQNNELNHFYEITNDIIRKITRYAQQIGQQRLRMSNRTLEYRHIAKMFSECESISDAHKLSASVFGIAKPFHLHDLQERDTEDIDSHVFSETPTSIEFEARGRIVKRNNVRNLIEDVSYKQELDRHEIERSREIEKKLLLSYLVDDCIEFDNLNQIDSFSRKVLLSWVSKAYQSSDLKSKTDFDLEYYLDDSKKYERCIVKCDDGDFSMPKLKLIFKVEEIE